VKVTDYTMDPRNAHVVRYLQSRPIQIGTSGFVHSVAMFLDTAGNLSRAQRESLEGIMKKSNWEAPDPLPPTVDDRGERVLVYVTPGCHPGNDFMEALGERYRPLGKIGVRCVHDPVYKHVIDPSIRPGAVHRLGTSCGTYDLPGTGYALSNRKADRTIDPENAALLNEVVSPLLSTPDTTYAFRPAKVGSTWWVFGQRQMNPATTNITTSS
jgi:hypothetical protein